MRNYQVNFWENKKVLVAGGAGFVGSHVVELLVEKGARTVVIDNLENGTLENLTHVRDEVECHRASLCQT